MANKTLGTAKFSAYRLGGVTTLAAIGETAYWNDKVDFEELPFIGDRPAFAFVVTRQDVGLPAIRPFSYEEQVFVASSATSVLVEAADGVHDIAISQVRIPPVIAGADPDDQSEAFCVYRTIGILHLWIGRCDDKVPMIYEKVFGPATQQACEEYVRDNGGR
jgi:hypothetical protein